MAFTDFDGVYCDRAAFYGAHPSPFLVHYLDKYAIAARGAGLDLGCGQGRNALHLAACGFTMHAVDGSAQAIDRLLGIAQTHGLSVSGQVADLATLEIEAGRYDLIVANTSLDHLTAEEGERLAARMVRGLAPGGVLFVSVFMRDDPGCEARGRQPSETAAYVRHYYHPGELKAQFATLELLAYQEEYALDVGHGVPHYHAIARLFARRD
jgi:SAM-dependent methyltransferase